MLFLCKRKWPCLPVYGFVFHQPPWIRNCRKRPKSTPNRQISERTFFERRMQIKTNFMLAACFNNQQKIDIICQVLIQIALIRSPSGDGLLPWSTLIFVWVTLELQRKDLLNPSFVEFFPWELAVFVQFFQLRCWSASYPFRYKLKSSV